jgi:hypothetical protein
MILNPNLYTLLDNRIGTAKPSQSNILRISSFDSRF